MKLWLFLSLHYLTKISSVILRLTLTLQDFKFDKSDTSNSSVGVVFLISIKYIMIKKII